MEVSRIAAAVEAVAELDYQQRRKQALAKALDGLTEDQRRLEWAPQGPRPGQQNKKDCDYCGIRSIENYECTVKKYQVLPIKRRC